MFFPHRSNTTNHFFGVTAIRTNVNSTSMVQNNILILTNNIVYKVPVIIAISNKAKRLMRIQFCTHLNEEIFFIAIHSKVTCGARMFYACRPATNIFLFNICTIVITKILDGRNSRSLSKAGKESSTRNNCSFKTGHTSERKISATNTLPVYIIRSQIHVLFNNLTIDVSSSSSRSR